jgi:hypothetical protein
VRFRLHRHGSTVQAELTQDGITLTHVDGIGVPVDHDGEKVVITPGTVLQIPGT